MLLHPYRSLLVALVLAGAVSAQPAATPVGTPAGTPAAAKAVCGRVEDLGGGLKLLRVWGTPAERGYAHGYLMGDEIAAGAIAEFTVRFGSNKPLLELVRSSLDRLIEYPADVAAEIEALYRGLVDSGTDLEVAALGRAFDLTDLEVTNALDVFGLMGCSGFTVWGEQAVGGGVLSARNFDWPFTGEHLLSGTVLLVQHRPDGATTASVTWPGYVATVTGISSEGVAAFLHVGTGKVTLTPEPGSWPTAVAARALLERLRAESPADESFARAVELLSYTSPPAGYLTRVVLPVVPAQGPPVAVFETDARKSVRGGKIERFSVVTNHFRARSDGTEPSPDSLDREEQLCLGLGDCLIADDAKVSPAEAWELLTKVDRGGGRRFGTLHSLVFRHEPWCFELRIGTFENGRIVAATRSARRFALTREQVFGKVDPLAK